MGRKTPKIAPSPWDFVTLPEEDRATIIGNMPRKTGKDRSRCSGDMLADGHTYTHTHRFALITILRHSCRWRSNNAVVFLGLKYLHSLQIRDIARGIFQMLRDRFKEFARDTESIGQERVAAVNEVCDRLISGGHSDAAVIAEWKDTINELWADLLEMIDTRTQMLAASYELFKFYNDCKELLERIRVSLSWS